MKILIIANANVVFPQELKTQLTMQGFNVHLLDFESLTLYNSQNNVIDAYRKKFLLWKSIPKVGMFFRMRLIKKVIQENSFAIVNIHISRWFYLALLPWIRKEKLVITFYGSDFYRTSNFVKKIQTLLYERADALTFTNDRTKQSFLEFYKDFQAKSFVCRFGLKTLDFIDSSREKSKLEIRKYLGYSLKKVIVTCGYNATPAQRHEQIINNLQMLQQRYKMQCQFIFPLTYGENSDKEKIKKILKNTDLDYIVLEDFLYEDDNAYVKLASDVMINMLQTDSFSGSMQEFLYADNIIITGSWLPYGILDKKGVVYEKIETIDTLQDKLRYVLENLETIRTKIAKNKKVISELSHWKNAIGMWNSLFQRVVRD